MLLNRLSDTRRREIDQIGRDTAARVSANTFVVAARANISICHKPYQNWHALGELHKSRFGYTIFLADPIKTSQRHFVMAQLIGQWVLHRSYYHSESSVNWITFGGLFLPSKKGISLMRDAQEADAFAAGFLLEAEEQMGLQQNMRQLHRRTGLPMALIKKHLSLAGKRDEKPWIEKQISTAMR